MGYRRALRGGLWWRRPYSVRRRRERRGRLMGCWRLLYLVYCVQRMKEERMSLSPHRHNSIWRSGFRAEFNVLSFILNECSFNNSTCQPWRTEHHHHQPPPKSHGESRRPTQLAPQLASSHTTLLLGVPHLLVPPMTSMQCKHNTRTNKLTEKLASLLVYLFGLLFTDNLFALPTSLPIKNKPNHPLTPKPAS